MGVLKITLVKSVHGRLPAQKATLEALGLRSINKSVEQPDNKPIRGMIETVRHLVKIEK